MASTLNDFSTFNSNDINIRDRKHMSIIDNPAFLSPGGNTIRKPGTPYRLSDLISLSASGESNRNSRESKGESAGGVDKDGEAKRHTSPIGEGDLHSEQQQDSDEEPHGCEGDNDAEQAQDEVMLREDCQKTPLKTRRTGMSTPNIDIPRTPTDKEAISDGSDAEDDDLSALSMDEAVSAGYSGIGPEDDNSPMSETSWTKHRSKMGEEGSDSECASKKSNHSSDMSVLMELQAGRAASPERSGLTPLPLNQENIAVGISWLWQTSAFSDLTISSGDYNFPVHKCIVAAQCRRFNDLIRATSTSEGKLELNDNDPEALKAMLQHLYTGCLVVPTTNVIILGGPAVPSIDILLKVYELSCKYELPQLKNQAIKQYTEVLSKQWSKGHALFLAKCMVKVFKMAESAEQVEKSSAGRIKELQDVTISVAVKFAEELVNDPVVYDLLDGKPMRALTAALLKSIRQGSVLEAKRRSVEPSDSLSVLSMPLSECSAEGMWR